MNWVSSALLATIGFSAMVLLLRKVTEVEPRVEVVNFYLFLFTAIGYLVFGALRRARLDLQPRLLPAFIALATIAVVANYLSVSAIRTAPNPGYVMGLRAFEAVIITLSAYFLLGSEITPTKLAGILMAVGGVILLSR